MAVTLSQPLSGSAPTLNALRVYSSQRGGRVAGTTTVSGNTLTFDPMRNFKPGEVVRVTVTNRVLSTSSAALPTPQVFQFTTAVQGGNGQFGSGVEVVVGPAPSNLAVGDIDGDGDLDLAVANTGPYSTPGNTVSIRLNIGNGIFGAPAAGAELTVGTGPQHVVLADVDGDGDLDLLTANQNRSTVSLRLNNGAGSFAAPATGAEVPINAAAALVLADVDADGDLDLLAVNGIYSAAASGTASIRLNDGSGQFSVPAAGGQVVLGNGPFIPLAADVDGDGDLDLLVPNDGASQGGGTVSVRLNNGQGDFAAPPTGSEVPLFQGVDEAVVGDIDGDGDLDLLAVNFGGPTSTGTTVSVRLNDGSGAFATPAVGAEVPVGDGPRSLALGDVDGDGDLDLVVANTGLRTPGNTVSIRLNSGLNSGNFIAPTTGAEFAVGSVPHGVVLADVDNDGDLDALTANQASNTVSVRFNNGTGVALAAAAARELVELSVAPNPTHGAAMVRLMGGPGAAPATLTVLDALGRTVRMQRVGLPLAGGPTEVVLVGLNPGLYHVRVQTGAEQSSRVLAVE